MSVVIYLILLVIEMGYMISIPAELTVRAAPVLTTKLFEVITVVGVYVIGIIVALLLLVQALFIFFHGRSLKLLQSTGQETHS